MSLFHCALQPSVYIHVLENAGFLLFFFFFGAKMKGSQLGSKRDSEHFVSQQVGELQEFPETSLSFLGVIYRVRLLRWSPNKHKDLKCVKHGKLT